MQPYSGHPFYHSHSHFPSNHFSQGPSNGYSYGHQPPFESREPAFIPPTPIIASAHTRFHCRSSSGSASAPSSMRNLPRISQGGRNVTHLGRYHSIPGTQPYSSRGFLPAQTNHLDFRPLHMFMLFIGSNELRLENIMKPAMEELREAVLPMWPDGIESDSQRGYNWTVRFRNNPWSLRGPHNTKAREIIVQLFTLFARRGFTFLTSTKTWNPPPRLIFEVSSADTTSYFFLAYFSCGGKRFNIIKPPQTIDSLGAQLKAVLPRKVDEVDEDTIGDHRIIEIRKKRGFGRAEVEPAFFFMHVLKILSELGFNLLAAIPLGRRGLFGVGGQKEMLVFRGVNS